MLLERSREFSKDVDTLVLCIVIPGATQDAMCRECLAMYSTGFAIRTNYLMHESKYLGEICVFPTAHGQEIILENCENIFCHQMFSLKLSKCEIIHKKHPNDLAILRNEDMMHDSSAKSVKHKNSWKGRDIDGIMEHIALKHMRRSRDEKKFQASELRSRNTIEGLVSKDCSCIC